MLTSTRSLLWQNEMLCQNHVFTTLVSSYISPVGFAIILIFAFTNDRNIKY